jgi:hypothetical protein
LFCLRGIALMAGQAQDQLLALALCSRQHGRDDGG